VKPEKGRRTQEAANTLNISTRKCRKEVKGYDHKDSKQLSCRGLRVQILSDSMNSANGWDSVLKSGNVHEMFEQLVRRFVAWAETRSDVRAAIVLGSRARTEFPADEWADLDIVIVTSNPERYVSSADWLQGIGKPLLTFIEPTSGGDEMERRVLFEGMLDVDFAVFPLAKAQAVVQGGIDSAQASNAFGRGFCVIVDKDGIGSKLQVLASSIKNVAASPPTLGEFLQVVNDFLYHAVFTAKHLKRGELWWAKMSSDCYMQQLLLRMIEWHSHVRHGWSYDTWFRGRFLEKWAEPEVLEKMRNVFSHYDEADVQRGLLAAMALFRTIAVEVAEKLTFDYPLDADQQVTEWIKARFSD
jgi:aminoglycoside 6-adenylyltransferase